MLESVCLSRLRPPPQALLVFGLTCVSNICTAGNAVPICTAGNGLPGCAPCIKGTYSAAGNATLPQPGCTACPIGFTTAGAGATSKASCSVKTGALLGLCCEAGVSRRRTKSCMPLECIGQLIAPHSTRRLEGAAGGGPPRKRRLSSCHVLCRSDACSPWPLTAPRSQEGSRVLQLMTQTTATAKRERCAGCRAAPAHDVARLD